MSPTSTSLALMVLLVCVSGAQVAAPQRVRVSAGVESGLLQTRVAPIYPPLARQARIQGTVVLTVIISGNGDVQNVSLFSGHPMLAPAAIEAVKQWKYRPYLLNGEPIEVETQVQVNFSLSDKPASEGVAGDIPGGAMGGVIGSMVTTPPSDSTQTSPPQRIRVSSGVSQGLIVKKVAPLYPEDARAARIQGAVLLKATIDKEGNIANLELISGHPMLVPAAMEAVKQWKYRPYLLAGRALVVETQIQVNFTLQR